MCVELKKVEFIYYFAMNKKYLIFGATGSIGSSLANQMHEEKQDCHLVGRNQEELKEIANKLSYSYSVCDVLKLNFADKLFKDLAETEILGMAYCVGSIDLKPLKIVKEDYFQKCIKINLYSAVKIIKEYQDSLKKNKGSIVLFSSVAAQRGFPNHSIIASAKAAVRGLTISLAAEFAPNIRVNCIAPSLTNSKISQPILKNNMMAEGIKKAHPMKRIGEGKDIAAMAKFLLTEESSWITGQIIGVDGGRSSL